MDIQTKFIILPFPYCLSNLTSDFGYSDNCPTIVEKNFLSCANNMICHLC